MHKPDQRSDDEVDVRDLRRRDCDEDLRQKLAEADPGDDAQGNPERQIALEGVDRGLCRHSIGDEGRGRHGVLLSGRARQATRWPSRSEEHTSELQSLMSRSYAVCCWKK